MAIVARRPRTSGVLLALAAALGLGGVAFQLIAGHGSADAAISCSFSGGVATITMDAGGTLYLDQPERDNDGTHEVAENITYADNASNTSPSDACTGAPNSDLQTTQAADATTNVDRINIVVAGGGDGTSETVIFDTSSLNVGSAVNQAHWFGPGETAEASVAASEIEITVDIGTGPNDTVTVLGVDNDDDAMYFGQLDTNGINVAGGFAGHVAGFGIGTDTDVDLRLSPSTADDPDRFLYETEPDGTDGNGPDFVRGNGNGNSGNGGLLDDSAAGIPGQVSENGTDQDVIASVVPMVVRTGNNTGTENIALGDAADILDAGGGADTVVGGGGNDILKGGNSADTIEGNDGDDVMQGGCGDDTFGITVAKTNGNDTYYEGEECPSSDNDVILGNAGIDVGRNDTVVYFGRTDAVSVSADGTANDGCQAGAACPQGVNETDNVGRAIENIITTDLNDTITVSALYPDNIVWPADGDDSINFGTDGTSDILSYGKFTVPDGWTACLSIATCRDASTFDGAPDTLYDGDDGAGLNLDPSCQTADRNDATFCDDQNVLKTGGSGNDTITGGNFDHVVGSELADTMRIGYGTTAYGMAGSGGDDTISSSIVTDLTAVAHNYVGTSFVYGFAGGDGADNIDGNSGADTLGGNAGVDDIDGAAGNDTVAGGAGADTVNGAAGNDTLAGGNEPTSEVQTVSLSTSGTVTGGSITLTVNSVTTAAISADTAGDGITAADIQSAIDTAIGAGRVVASGGPLLSTGGTTPMTYVVLRFIGNLANTDVPGLAATSSLTGGIDVSITTQTTNGGSNGTGSPDASIDTVNGGADNDTIFGSAPIASTETATLAAGGLSDGDLGDTLNGDAGNDIIYGGDGNDTVRGSLGRDYLSGGPGNDTFDESDTTDGGGADAINGNAGTTDTVDYGTRAASIIREGNATNGQGRCDDPAVCPSTGATWVADDALGTDGEALEGDDVWQDTELPLDPVTIERAFDLEDWNAPSALGGHAGNGADGRDLFVQWESLVDADDGFSKEYVYVVPNDTPLNVTASCLVPAKAGCAQTPVYRGVFDTPPSAAVPPVDHQWPRIQTTGCTLPNDQSGNPASTNNILGNPLSANCGYKAMVNDSTGARLGQEANFVGGAGTDYAYCDATPGGDSCAYDVYVVFRKSNGAFFASDKFDVDIFPEGTPTGVPAALEWQVQPTDAAANTTVSGVANSPTEDAPDVLVVDASGNPVTADPENDAGVETITATLKRTQFISGASGATNDVITTDAVHGLAVNDPIEILVATGGTGLTTRIPYYVRTVPSTTTFTLGTTRNAAADVDITGAYTDTITYTAPKTTYGGAGVGMDVTDASGDNENITNAGDNQSTATAEVDWRTGIATFDSFNIDQAWYGYALQAAYSNGGAGTAISDTPYSDTFDITPGAPAKVIFITQPPDGTPNVNLTPAVCVGIADSLDNQIVDDPTAGTEQITLTQRTGTPTSGGTGNVLSGGTATTIPWTGLIGSATVGGACANFTGLQMTVIGDDYRLDAVESGFTGDPAITDAISNVFDIIDNGPNNIVFTVDPTNMVAGANVDATADTRAGLVVNGGNPVCITVRDASNVPINSDPNAAGGKLEKIRLSLTAGTPQSGVLGTVDIIPSATGADGDRNPVDPGATVTIESEVNWANAGGCGNGSAEFDWMTIQRAGTGFQFTATYYDGDGNATAMTDTSDLFDVWAAAPATMTWTQEPSHSIVNTEIDNGADTRAGLVENDGGGTGANADAVQVAVLDAFGNRAGDPVVARTERIRMALDSPGGASNDVLDLAIDPTNDTDADENISTTVRRSIDWDGLDDTLGTADDATVTELNLNIDTADTGYQLNAIYDGDETTDNADENSPMTVGNATKGSALFDIYAGAPATMTWTQEPTHSIVNTEIDNGADTRAGLVENAGGGTGANADAVQVAVLDAFGNRANDPVVARTERIRMALDSPGVASDNVLDLAIDATNDTDADENISTTVRRSIDWDGLDNNLATVADNATVTEHDLNIDTAAAGYQLNAIYDGDETTDNADENAPMTVGNATKGSALFDVYAGAPATMTFTQEPTDSIANKEIDNGADTRAGLVENAGGGTGANADAVQVAVLDAFGNRANDPVVARTERIRLALDAPAAAADTKLDLAIGTDDNASVTAYRSIDWDGLDDTLGNADDATITEHDLNIDFADLDYVFNAKYDADEQTATEDIGTMLLADATKASALFDIFAGAPAKMSWVVQPTSSVANKEIDNVVDTEGPPSVENTGAPDDLVVAVLDAFDNRASDPVVARTERIRLALDSPGAATNLRLDLSIAADSNVDTTVQRAIDWDGANNILGDSDDATITEADLNIDFAADGYKFTAKYDADETTGADDIGTMTLAEASKDSDLFDIFAGAATKLIWQSQWVADTDFNKGSPLTPSVVCVADAFDNVVPETGTNITISMDATSVSTDNTRIDAVPGPNPEATVSGCSDFTSQLNIDEVANNYVFDANTTGRGGGDLTTVPGNEFDIVQTATGLKIISHPPHDTPYSPDEPINDGPWTPIPKPGGGDYPTNACIQVAVVDADGEIVTAYPATLLTLTFTGGDGTATLTNATATTAGGIATYCNLSIDKPAQDYVLTGDDGPGGLPPSDPGPRIDIIAPPPVNQLPTAPGIVIEVCEPGEACYTTPPENGNALAGWDPAPPNPKTNAHLRVRIVTPSTDPAGDGDGDGALTYRYEWWVNGINRGDENTGPTATLFDIYDIAQDGEADVANYVTIRARAHDSVTFGLEAEQTVQVDNTAPVTLDQVGHVTGLSTTSLRLAANDADAMVLKYRMESAPTCGSVAVVDTTPADGVIDNFGATLSFTAPAGPSTCTFTYAAGDTLGVTDTWDLTPATFTVKVGAASETMAAPSTNDGAGSDTHTWAPTDGESTDTTDGIETVVGVTEPDAGGFNPGDFTVTVVDNPIGAGDPDPDGASPDGTFRLLPVEQTVTVRTAGDTLDVDSSDEVNFSALADRPIALTFRLGTNIVPTITPTSADDALVAAIKVFRDGVEIPACSGVPVAEDACVASRTRDATTGDVIIVVNTFRASTWNFAAPLARVTAITSGVEGATNANAGPADPVDADWNKEDFAFTSAPLVADGADRYFCQLRRGGDTIDVLPNTPLTANDNYDCGTVVAGVGSAQLDFNGLPDDVYTFRVQADDGGNIARRDFVLDRTAPAISVTSGPANASTITVDNVTYTFTSNEPGSTYSCQLNLGLFVACNAKTVTYAGLAAGDYTVTIRATDLVGNASTAVRTFTYTPGGGGGGGGGGAPTTTTTLADPRDPVRIAGRDRSETAELLSRVVFPDGADTVYIATQWDYADALSSGHGAVREEAPVLLTAIHSLNENTAAELERLKPRRIVVMGGWAAVDDNVFEQLRAYASEEIVRIAGVDRFGTAAALSQDKFPNGADTVYLATGRSYPDALAGGLAASEETAPVLLTEPNVLPVVTADELLRLQPERIVVIGGTGTVARGLEALLRDYAPVVERVAGTDRYETTATVNSMVVGGTDTVFIVTGKTFADALTGIPIAALTDSAVLMVGDGPLHPSVVAELQRIQPRNVIVLGGTAAVAERVELQIAAYMGEGTGDGERGLQIEQEDIDSAAAGIDAARRERAARRAEAERG